MQENKKRKKFDDFSKEERTIIGEFVYSKANNILFSEDGHALINLLEAHKMIDNAQDLRDGLLMCNKGISSMLGNVLHYGIEPEDGKRIMNEYYGNENE
jgi:hypothetical protein